MDRLTRSKKAFGDRAAPMASAVNPVERAESPPLTITSFLAVHKTFDSFRIVKWHKALSAAFLSQAARWAVGPAPADCRQNVYFLTSCRNLFWGLPDWSKA